MAKRRPDPKKPHPSGKKPRATPPARAAKRPAPASGEGSGHHRVRSEIRVRLVPGEPIWELVHPRSVRERAEDLEEVRSMLEAGEEDIAIDELRWLLNGCPDFIEAHRMLGELALAAGDVHLARAHFGFGYDLGLAAIPARGLKGPLPYSRPANQAFFESAKGLAWVFSELGMPDRAREVLDTMLRLDPSDPLGAQGVRDKLGKPAARDG